MDGIHHELDHVPLICSGRSHTYFQEQLVEYLSRVDYKRTASCFQIGRTDTHCSPVLLLVPDAARPMTLSLGEMTTPYREAKAPSKSQIQFAASSKKCSSHAHLDTFVSAPDTIWYMEPLIRFEAIASIMRNSSAADFPRPECLPLLVLQMIALDYTDRHGFTQILSGFWVPGCAWQQYGHTGAICEFQKMDKMLLVPMQPVADSDTISHGGWIYLVYHEIRHMLLALRLGSVRLFDACVDLAMKCFVNQIGIEGVLDDAVKSIPETDMSLRKMATGFIKKMARSYDLISRMIARLVGIYRSGGCQGISIPDMTMANNWDTHATLMAVSAPVAQTWRRRRFVNVGTLREFQSLLWRYGHVDGTQEVAKLTHRSGMTWSYLRIHGTNAHSVEQVLARTVSNSDFRAYAVGKYGTEVALVILSTQWVLHQRIACIAFLDTADSVRAMTCTGAIWSRYTVAPLMTMLMVPPVSGTASDRLGNAVLYLNILRRWVGLPPVDIEHTPGFDQKCVTEIMSILSLPAPGDSNAYRMIVEPLLRFIPGELELSMSVLSFSQRAKDMTARGMTWWEIWCGLVRSLKPESESMDYTNLRLYHKAIVESKTQPLWRRTDVAIGAKGMHSDANHTQMRICARENNPVYSSGCTKNCVGICDRTIPTIGSRAAQALEARYLGTDDALGVWSPLGGGGESVGSPCQIGIPCLARMSYPLGVLQHRSSAPEWIYVDDYFYDCQPIIDEKTTAPLATWRMERAHARWVEPLYRRSTGTGGE